ELRDAAGMFKVGSHLFPSAGPEFVREIVRDGARVFLDLKFHDIPATVAAAYKLARGSLAIVGVGGVFTAEDAWEKIAAGAGLVQLYTGFVYEGFGVARRINEGLAALLERHGLRTLDDAVGCRAEEFAPL
ncbi:MAG TPA: orotidine 5'-phosphate decarboxylase / HUMPS family protein, partial [Pyrinomonadaceae bacterium]